jgi:hypothetical protein
LLLIFWQSWITSTVESRVKVNVDLPLCLINYHAMKMCPLLN